MDYERSSSEEPAAAAAAAAAAGERGYIEDICRLTNDRSRHEQNFRRQAERKAVRQADRHRAVTVGARQAAPDIVSTGNDTLEDENDNRNAPV